MNYITKKHLSRRHVLRGMGGVTIALPLLHSMLPASSAWAQAAAKPKARFAAIYMAHGKTMAKWTPATEGKNFEMSEILTPLAPFRDHLNIISGMRATAAYDGNGSAANNHGTASSTFLTCNLPTGGRSITSMDQLIAQKISQDTPLPSMELTIEGNARQSWSNETTSLPMQINPQVVFDNIFGEGGTEAERLARRAQTRSLLDSVTDQIGGLNRDLPSTDVARLDQYLTDIREIERRIDLSTNLPPGVDMPARPAGIPNNFGAHCAAMFDLMALAWQAEITRVSTLMMAPELSSSTYPDSGVRDAFHVLSHHGHIQANKDRFAILNTYHVTQLAYFFNKLKNTPDGDGTLLDHSLTMYGSGLADANAHDHDPIPMALIGGANGNLEGNRHLRFPDHTPVANLYAAILNKMGVEVEKFGDGDRILSI